MSVISYALGLWFYTLWLHVMHLSRVESMT